MERFKIIPKSNIDMLPKRAGVYYFINKREIIYIGKAINIRDRVKNHFNQPSYRDNLFIDKVDKIGYLETNSEIEALILEANLIKKYQPKFNVVWRDDKNYFHVAINREGIPYIFITHQKNQRKTKYIGPFVEGTALKKTLRFLRRAFPYYTSKKHPKTKCTWCHLDLCPGPEPDLKLYKKNIKKLILILKGKRIAVLNSLKKEMNQLSKDNRFEEAGKIRDRIFALQQIMSHMHVIESEKKLSTPDTSAILAKIIGIKVKISRIECYDVSNIQGKQATASMVVFISGMPDKNLYRKFKIRGKNSSPTNFEMGKNKQSPMNEKKFSKLVGDKPNDIAMLEETLIRRLKHNEWDYPDIILIDGGKAQLNIAIKSKLQNPNYKTNPKIKNIKIISIAKGRQELFIERPKGYPKNPIPLKSLPQEIYNLIKNLDDEAHRFAIAYHRKLRKKNLLK